MWGVRGHAGTYIELQRVRESALALIGVEKCAIIRTFLRGIKGNIQGPPEKD